MTSHEPRTKCRVLVVEDDAVSCQAMRALLVRWGFEVETCTTAEHALEEIRRYRPQCLILDLMLTDGNGVEILRTIRLREMNIRVAVVTAAHDAELLKDVRELGPDLLLKKPVDLPQLKRWLMNQYV